jgi:phospholipase D1/2
MSRRDDDLAYGDYYARGGEGEEGDRGLIGDMGRRFGFGRKEVSTFF